MGVAIFPSHMKNTILFLTALTIVTIAGPAAAHARCEGAELVLRVFTASWCGACRTQHEMLAREGITDTFTVRVGDQNRTVCLLELDIDVPRNNDLADREGVTHIPTNQFLRDGQVRGRRGTITSRSALDEFVRSSLNGSSASKKAPPVGPVGLGTALEVLERPSGDARQATTSNPQPIPSGGEAPKVTVPSASTASGL